VVCGLLYLISPTTLKWSLPLTLGYLVAVPFAMITASPTVGRLFQKLGICGIPEDFAPPKEITAVMRT
jgi:membrane glycosyltransferase